MVGMSFSAQLLPLAADMIWLRKGGPRGATLGLLAGLITVAIMNSHDPQNGITIGDTTYRMMGGAWGLLVNIPIFVGVSFFEKAPERRQAFEAVLNNHASHGQDGGS